MTNRFVYGQGIQPIAGLNDSGGIKSQFVYAYKGHVPDLMIKNGVTYRFVTDQVGSVRMAVNTADGTQFETHWVENLVTGQRGDFKTKIVKPKSR